MGFLKHQPYHMCVRRHIPLFSTRFLRTLEAFKLPKNWCFCESRDWTSNHWWFPCVFYVHIFVCQTSYGIQSECQYDMIGDAQSHSNGIVLRFYQLGFAKKNRQYSPNDGLLVIYHDRSKKITLKQTKRALFSAMFIEFLALEAFLPGQGFPFLPLID